MAIAKYWFSYRRLVCRSFVLFSSSSSAAQSCVGDLLVRDIISFDIEQVGIFEHDIDIENKVEERDDEKELTTRSFLRSFFSSISSFIHQLIEVFEKITKKRVVDVYI